MILFPGAFEFAFIKRFGNCLVANSVYDSFSIHIGVLPWGFKWLGAYLAEINIYFPSNAVTIF